jgi:hypothetical protein
VSYSGSSDDLLCDSCLGMGCTDMVRPWPPRGPLLGPDGRVAPDHRACFHICGSCLQSLVLEAPLEPHGRKVALASAARWEASRRLLTEAERVLRGQRPPGRRDAA